MKNNKDILNDIYKELTQLVYSFFKKYKFIFFCLLIFIALIKILECIPLKIIPGSTDAWLGFWATIIGTCLSVFFTIFVMLYTLKIDQRNRDIDKKPIIIPDNTTFSNLVLIDGYPENFDDIKNSPFIEIYNLGQTDVFDISGTVQVLEINNDYRLLTYKDDEIEFESNFYTHGGMDKNVKLQFNKNLDLPYQEKTILSAGSNIKLKLPKEISLLTLILSKEQYLKSLSNTKNKNFSIKLEINLSFKDYKGYKNNCKFRAELSTHNYSTNNPISKSNHKTYSIDGKILIINRLS